jgi:hypothetical protein
MSLPNEHWQGQQKVARAKLAKLEAADKEVEASIARDERKESL